MRIRDLTELEKVAITREYVSYGIRYVMDRHMCTNQQVKTIAGQVRKKYCEDWCKKHKALPEDLSIALCIDRWMPTDKNLRREYMRFFNNLDKDYSKVIKTVDSTLYKLPRTVPDSYKEAFVSGIRKSGLRSEILESIPLDHSVLRNWQKKF